MNLHPWFKKLTNQNLANVAFLLMSSGFFFFHFAVGSGLISQHFSRYSYYDLYAVFFFPPLIFAYLKSQSLNFNDKVFLLFNLIVIYTLATATLNFLLNKPYGYSYDMIVWSVSGVFFNVMTFLIGAQINFQKIIKINIFFFILMFLAIVLNIGENHVFDLKYKSNSSAHNQSFAICFVFISLILTAFFIENYKLSILIFVLSYASLFICGARSEFIIYVASCFIMLGLYAFKSLRFFFLLVTIMILFLLMTYFFFDLLPSSRMHELYKPQEAKSLIARFNFNEYAYSQIVNNPLIGSYGTYVYLDGIGSYPHNLLSAWVNLGFFGFLFYVILFIILLKAVFSGFKKNSNNFMYRIFLIFFLFTVMSMFFSKNYNFIMLGFLIGIYINLKNLNIFKFK